MCFAILNANPLKHTHDYLSFGTSDRTQLIVKLEMLTFQYEARIVMAEKIPVFYIEQ